MKLIQKIKDYFAKDFSSPLKADSVRFKYKDISVLFIDRKVVWYDAE